MEKSKGMKKKYLSWVYGVDRKVRQSGSLFGIIRELGIPISDPRDRFFFIIWRRRYSVDNVV